MKNPYNKINEKTILSKVNRKRNPVSNLVQLANEFGLDTTFTRSNGRTGNRAPKRFTTTVRSFVGTKTYDRIRDRSKIRAA